MDCKELYVFTGLCVLMSVVGMSLHIWIIVIIARNETLQVLENSFLVGLAVMDAIGTATYFSYPVVFFYAQNDELCLANIVITTYLCNACLLSLAVMSVDKYMRICHPFQHVYLLNKKNVCISMVFVHVVAMSSGVVGVFLYHRDDDALCSVYFVFADEMLLFAQLCFFVCLFTIALFNVRILHVSHKKRNEVHCNANNAASQGFQGVKILAVVVMFNFILYIPGWLVMMLQATSNLPVETQESYVLWATALWMLTPVADGIGFLFCRKDIRKYALKVFRYSRD